MALKRILLARCPFHWLAAMLIPGVWLLAYVIFTETSATPPLSARLFLIGVIFEWMTLGYYMAETCFRNLVSLLGVDFRHWPSLLVALPFWSVWFLSAVGLHVAFVVWRYWILFVLLCGILSVSAFHIVFPSLT